ncbi:MAG: gliding motility-associated C-terminal domain-containing protein [Bacteroidota bacterium]
MNGEGGNFEQRIREHLEGFSPEVPQGLWEELSTRLPEPAPATPTVQPGMASVGTTLIKKMLVAALLGGGLLGGWMLVNSQSAQSPATEQRIPDQNNVTQESAAESGIGFTHTQPNDRQVEPGSITKEQNAEILAPANEATHAGSTQNPSLHSGEYKQDVVSGATPYVQGSASVTNKNNSASAHTVPSQSPEDPATATPLKLILSARAGFAPLRVTAMGNQQGRPVDFTLPDGTKTRSGAGVSFDCSEPGTFSICCESTGQQVCENVVVLGRTSNAFSPNGDGINERFAVESADPIEGELRIYSRDGRLLYRTRSLSQGWDGRLATGEFAPEGTYIFDIFVGSSEAGPIQQKGTLQLFR